MDNDLTEAIQGLIESGHEQSKNIDALADNMTALIQAVRMRPTRKETFGTVGALVSVILLLNLFMFGLVYKTALDANHGSKAAASTANFIADCLNPQGKCYAESQRLNDLNRKVISLRSEQIRLADEIKVADAKDDTIAAATRQAELNDVNKRLTDAGQIP